ncbi:precorrin 6A synthase [Streptomyces alboflavus]|uniref:Precorrin 6A synthase n=1 Tax=Streptomyces alboflavus TaxID=67267 RepID=A0A1Z1WNN7_9ACTN|nr:precorrin 6A synthase [Streptomyces alboflavus]
MRKIHVIGIGAGDPDQLTLQAVKAFGDTDVFFILGKGEEKADLVALRRGMLDAHRPDGAYRVVEARDPERDRKAGGADYSPAVDDWRSRRADIYERLIADELGPDQTGRSSCGATRRCTTARSGSWRRCSGGGPWPSATTSSPASAASPPSPPATAPA